MDSIAPEAAETPFEALSQSFIMIVVSEIGDKTFLIAAIMAVRHPRITVFGGAFSSLIVMSVLSAALGRVILGLIPRVWTHYAAALLFLVFGLRMLQEGLKIPAGQGHIQEEMREVEEELDEDEQSAKMDRRGLSGLEAMEEGLDGASAGSPLMAQPRGEEDGAESNGNGHGYKMSSMSKHRSGVSITPGRRSQTFHPLSQPSPVAPVSVSNPLLRSFLTKLRGVARRNVDARDLKAGFRNTCGMFFSPVFAQAFVLTFLGEWGDRSQIATIALAGANSVGVVAFGTILGHGLCTFGAVMGGRWLSTIISVRHITLMGATAFLIFAGLYLWEAYTGSEPATPAARALAYASR